MKKTKDESPFSAFDSVIGNISGNNKSIDNDTANLDSSSVDDDDENVVVDLSIKLEKDDADIKPLAKDEEDDKTINDKSLKKDDDAEEVEEQDEKPAKKDKKTKEIDFTEEDEEDDKLTDTSAESSQVGLFFDAFTESLGWKVDDEEKKPSTIEGLIEYMQELVEENSTPDYADEKVKELDEYIRNGGSFESYYSASTQLTDLKNLDIENENVQKQVCKDWLKISGYTDAQISKKIQRWEDAGVLEDEANDNLELLTAHKEKAKEQELEKQKATRIKQEQDQQAFYSDVIKTIDGLKEIRGIKIPTEDRKKLKDYAFKVESDGTTKYQKEYAKNVAKNFIESAYFTMNGDTFTKSAKQAGESSAVAKLRQTMKNSTPGNSKHDMDNSSASPIWKAASSIFGVRS